MSRWKNFKVICARIFDKVDDAIEYIIQWFGKDEEE